VVSDDRTDDVLVHHDEPLRYLGALQIFGAPGSPVVVDAVAIENVRHHPPPWHETLRPDEPPHVPTIRLQLAGTSCNARLPRGAISRQLDFA
jgi:hypothetical protein